MALQRKLWAVDQALPDIRLRHASRPGSNYRALPLVHHCRRRLRLTWWNETICRLCSPTGLARRAIELVLIE